MLVLALTLALALAVFKTLNGGFQRLTTRRYLLAQVDNCLAVLVYVVEQSGVCHTLQAGEGQHQGQQCVSHGEQAHRLHR